MTAQVGLVSEKRVASLATPEQTSKWGSREVKKAVGATAVALSILSVVGVALFKTAPLWAPFLIASGPIGWAVAATVTVGFVVAVGMISLVASDVFVGHVARQSVKEEVQPELDKGKNQNVEQGVQSELDQRENRIERVTAMRVDEVSPRGLGRGENLDVIRQEINPDRKIQLECILRIMLIEQKRLTELESENPKEFAEQIKIYNEWTAKWREEFPVITKLQDLGTARIQRAEAERVLSLDEGNVSFIHKDRESEALEQAIKILNSFEGKEEMFNLVGLSDNRPENVRLVKPQNEDEMLKSPE